MGCWPGCTSYQAQARSKHTGGINAASYSPDGSQILTGSEDNTARVWDAKTGTELFALSGHSATQPVRLRWETAVD